MSCATKRLRETFHKTSESAGNRNVRSPVPPKLRRQVGVSVVLDSDRLLNKVACSNALDYLCCIPDASVNLVICSPPYYQQRKYAAKDSQAGNEVTVDAYVSGLIAVFEECVRVTRPDGSIIFNVGDVYLDSGLGLIPFRFAIAAKSVPGVKLVNNITWVKKNPTPRQFGRRMVNSTEPFYHFVKSGDYKYFPNNINPPKLTLPKPNSKCGLGYLDLIETSVLTPAEKAAARTAVMAANDRVRRGIIDSFRVKLRGIHKAPFGGQPGGRQTQFEQGGFTVIELHGRAMLKDYIEAPVASARGIDHPAVYPEEIVEWLVRLTTEPGDIVLDPYMGSGTTGVVAKRLGRNYLGCDLSEKYALAANRRLGNNGSTPRIGVGNLEEAEDDDVAA